MIIYQRENSILKNRKFTTIVYSYTIKDICIGSIVLVKKYTDRKKEKYVGILLSNKIVYSYEKEVYFKRET